MLIMWSRGKRELLGSRPDGYGMDWVLVSKMAPSIGMGQ